MTRASFLPVLLLPLLLFACDGDTDGPDPHEVCPTICQKTADCDELGNSTDEECVTECLGFADNMLDPYLEALPSGTEEKTCAELDLGVTAQGLCSEENVSLCTTNTDGHVEAACRLELSCDGIDDPTQQQLESCMTRMHGDGNILICFEPAKIAELEACVEAADRGNPNPVRACVDEVIGLELGI